MTTAEIVKLQEMYQAKADRAYRAYQETIKLLRSLLGLQKED